MTDSKPLSMPERKRLRGIGHDLRPIVTIGDKGLSEGVLKEVARALRDHELVKIKIAAGDRDDRGPIVDAICAETGAQPVATIGKTALIYRVNPKADARKSNVRQS